MMAFTNIDVIDTENVTYTVANAEDMFRLGLNTGPTRRADMDGRTSSATGGLRAGVRQRGLS